MTQARFTDVIDAIDALVAEEAVRFTPNPLQTSDVDEFIDQCLQRGAASGDMPSVINMTPRPEPVIAPLETRSAAPRRTRSTTRTREFTPRPNRFAATCSDCGEHVPAGAGLLTQRVGRRWLVSHSTCPTDVVQEVERRSTARRSTRRTAPPVHRDCYVVTVEVEVDARGVSSHREAALLAMREVFKGEVAVSVTADDEDDATEVTL